MVSNQRSNTESGKRESELKEVERFRGQRFEMARRRLKGGRTASGSRREEEENHR
ncbi:hypothetical protein A2U01_0004009 [Trifolium medium]|uniref:Uncharacterized protein n=1 Tax=Trifolium medium TaxID=97028 RepID=A0A392M6V3_9FABA|nr:hypothetical protein [Trifolium medium]